MAGAACSTRSAPPAERQIAVPMLGTAGAPTTSRDDLTKTIAGMESKLASNPGDAVAAVTLADALLRQARVTGNAALAFRAERALGRVLAGQPDHHHARRMLAAVQLSQHRFRDAIRTAERALQARRDDAWLMGVLGDASRARSIRRGIRGFRDDGAPQAGRGRVPRASYARELQGDWNGAIDFMEMALEATSARDPESLAWHHAQLGHLYLAIDRTSDARREFRHAEFAFPGHPAAGEGLARAMTAAGEHAAALARVRVQLSQAPSPSLLALSGDLLSALGRADEAEAQYRLAEAAWQTDAPEPARLALFLAERGRRIDEAVQLAERAAADRTDIFTTDALAWAYFKAGRLDDAQTAITRALRTGSRDRAIQQHANAIAAAVRERTRR